MGWGGGGGGGARIVPRPTLTAADGLHHCYVRTVSLFQIVPPGHAWPRGSQTSCGLGMQHKLICTLPPSPPKCTSLKGTCVFEFNSTIMQ